MFEFAWPLAALLLPLPYLVQRFLQPQRRPVEQGQPMGLLHPHLEQLAVAFQGAGRRSQRQRHWNRWLLWLVWVLLVLTLMQPQRLEQRSEVKTEGHDLMLAIDTSHSMEALDFTSRQQQVTRMAVVKGVISDFVDGRKGDRIGLIVFGSEAYALSPLTMDRSSVKRILQGLIPGVAGQGTALGDAILLGAKKLVAEEQGSRVLILVADGDSNAGLVPPLEAAKVAAGLRVRIHVIGVGSTQKSIPIVEQGRMVYRDDLTMDEDTLKEIAATTQGLYFRATDTQALESIYGKIDSLEKTQTREQTAWVPRSLFQWPLGMALLALLPLCFFPDGRPRRWN
jgi:Ca-activated chloride channel family protein